MKRSKDLYKNQNSMLEGTADKIACQLSFGGNLEQRIHILPLGDVAMHVGRC